MDQGEVNRELSHLFRREAGRIVAVLARIFGPDHLDLAETVVQEALVKAVQVWPLAGIPANPAGWIMNVAKNKALDALKRHRELQIAPEDLEHIPDGGAEDASVSAAFELELRDDQLRLMFICCHPVVPYEARLALTLKTICGFGVREIARAFLAKDETIAQRLVRAKQKIKDEHLAFELPDTDLLGERLDAVLDTVYLLFNEGYSASSGDWLTREDLCVEACRLARLIAEHKRLGTPKVQALLALMLFQSSRLAARHDAKGDVLLLEDQDRGLWDQERIAEGLSYLQAAASGDVLSEFHLLAGIAACHALAETFASTDWARILSYYDELVGRNPSPIMALNRAVALAFVKGEAAALKALDRIKSDPKMRDYYLFPATRADLLRRLGQYAKALIFYREALALVSTGPERRFLEGRLSECAALQRIVTAPP